MPVIHRKALLPLPVGAVFDVVWDVRRYPDFLPWCDEASVLEEHDREVVAELSIRALGLHERFTTRNVMIPYERIELHLVSGPFKTFEGAWHFKRLGNDEGARVELDLRFELAGARALIGGAFSGVFTRAADQMVDAFCERAMALNRV
ncbi:MAG TPA: type II toxin-antitoxin system RatA family toxin [Pseudomonadales bacterium]